MPKTNLPTLITRVVHTLGNTVPVSKCLIEEAGEQGLNIEALLNQALKIIESEEPDELVAVRVGPACYKKLLRLCAEIQKNPMPVLTSLLINEAMDTLLDKEKKKQREALSQTYSAYF